MRSRVVQMVVGAAVVALVLAVGVIPAGAGGGGQHDRWTGNWKVGNGKDNYGVLHLNLHADEKTVTGHYPFSGGGKVEGELNQRLGRFLEAKWKEKNQKGKFEVEISRGDPDKFHGTSWRTNDCPLFGCKEVKFVGHRL